MTLEEILDRIEVCPWRERRREGPCVCARFKGSIIPCDGACSWVGDFFPYLKLKELETKKIKL